VKVSNQGVSALKALPKTRNIIAGNEFGDIYMIYVEEYKK
jgi:hypothetical protein